MTCRLLFLAAILIAPSLGMAQEVSLVGSFKDFSSGSSGIISLAYDIESGALVVRRDSKMLVFVVKGNGSLFYNASVGFVNSDTILRDNSGKLIVELFDIIPQTMCLDRIVALLGSPHRDVGSGGSIMQWDVEDGSIVQVSSVLLKGSVGVVADDDICVRIMKDGSRRSVRNKTPPLPSPK
jgi:hypothetical protein